MLRKLHGLPSLFVAVFLIVLASSGVILSLQPTMEKVRAIVPTDGEVNVATLAQKIKTFHSSVQKIERSLAGTVIVFYQNSQNQIKSDVVNPLTGASITPYHPSTFVRWVKDLHRSFFMGKAGRGVAGAMAFVMVLLCLSGAFLLVHKMGGWKAFFKPLTGSGRKRLHSELARFAILGLLLSSLTGSYMSAVRFGWLPDHGQLPQSFPDQVSGGTPAPIASLAALRQVDINNLSELVFPYPTDPQDYFTLTTHQGSGFVDQVTGQLLNYQAFPKSTAFQHWMLRLHTGDGIWWLGLILGASALTVPVLSYTGVLIWWQRRKLVPSKLKSVDSQQADTLILVGTEGNTTWGFARELQANLNKAGCQVYCAKMNQLAPVYVKAKQMFILTSTFGNGNAPTSAQQFMNKLVAFKPNKGLKYAVLGFGDRQFPNFCQFAQGVEQALQAKNMASLVNVELIDRCSAAQFSAWGKAVAVATGLPIALKYNPQSITTTKLTLLAREDYGVNTQAATSILRFTLAQLDVVKPFGEQKAISLPFFEAGDLLGIVPPGETVARFYSLASSQIDGVVEICVRKQPNGVCSGYLHNLKLGDAIESFIRHNPEFRPALGSAPTILIGAGTGIGPLAGFIRKNIQRKPIYLYWGGRNPQGDFLYNPDLKCYLNDQRLTKLRTAFSQSKESIYVQDKLLQDQKAVRQLIEHGAQILVCGGRSMADGVNQVINEILEPIALDVHTLKAQSRYLEDVY